MYKFNKKGIFFYINIFFVLSIWFCIDTNFENILGTPTSSPFFLYHLTIYDNINFFSADIVSIKSIFMFCSGYNFIKDNGFKKSDRIF